MFAQNIFKSCDTIYPLGDVFSIESNSVGLYLHNDWISYIDIFKSTFPKKNITYYIYCMSIGTLPLMENKKEIDLLPSILTDWFNPQLILTGPPREVHNTVYCGDFDYYGQMKIHESMLKAIVSIYPKTYDIKVAGYFDLLNFSVLYQSESDKPIEIDYPCKEGCYYLAAKPVYDIREPLVYNHPMCKLVTSYESKRYKIINLYEFDYGNNQGNS